jgi:hypothetical protein
MQNGASVWWEITCFTQKPRLLQEFLPMNAATFSGGFSAGRGTDETGGWRVSGEWVGASGKNY